MPKKVLIKVLSDSIIRTIKAKAISYKFPYLTLLRKSDTIIVDVRKISRFNYKPKVWSGYYLLMIPTTALTIGFTSLIFTDPKEAGIFMPLILGSVFGSIDYFLYAHAYRRLDTKTIWSFY